MQENPEDVPAGEMPRNVTLCVTRNLVQKIVPGTRVKVMGVYTVGGGGGDRDKAQRGGGGSAVSQPYLNVCGLSEGMGRARGDHTSPTPSTPSSKSSRLGRLRT